MLNFQSLAQGKYTAQAACFLAVGLIVTNGALAQDTGESEEPVEEIVVTGIRSSIESAIGLKRNANQIMDAISAEDIGKLPDDNIGEALQRVTGISLTREAGEGKEVSIRGLGAGLSQVTVNGQRMASTEGNRSYNLSVLDASLVSALEVWKSPMAAQDEGSVGGSVNIVTGGPLDIKGNRTVVSGTAQLEELTDDWGDKYTLNMLMQNDERTFGAGLSVNSSTRLTRSDQVVIPGWTLIDSSSGDWSSRGWDDLAAANGLDEIIYPMDASSRVRLYDRDRFGANVTLQWRPTDKLDLRVDVFTSELEDYDTNQTAQVRIRDLVRGGGRDVTAYDWEFEGSNAVYFDTADTIPRAGWRALRNIATLRENEWSTSGAKAIFDISLTDSSVLTIQAGQNSGEGDLTTYPVVQFMDSVGFSVDLRDDPRFPQTIVAGGVDDAELEFRSLAINDRNSEESNDFAQLDFTQHMEGSHVAAIRVGVKYHQEDMSRWQTRHVSTGGVSGSLEDYALMCGNMPCSVPDFAYAGDTLAPFNGSFTLVDFDLVQADYPRDSREDRIAYNESWKVDEETFAAYFQIDLDGEVFGKPYRGNVGMRYYDTDLTSSGWLDAAGENSGKVERGYSDYLPSLNLSIALQEELLLRIGASKVMARADQEDLSFGGNFNVEQLTARVGNPYLDPFEATAYDLGIEWYFASAGLISAAVFYKDVDSFISNGVIEDGIVVETPEGELIFDAIGPINGEGATIEGIEVGYQQAFDFLPFPFDGFGLQLNYTYTDSDVEIPYTEGGQSFQMPLEGLSKYSYNSVVYYERDRFSARIAYNYRDKFLSNRSNTQGNPVFTDEYGQLDASVSWNVTDKVALTVNGINLNDEARYQYFLTPNRMLAHRASGRRFAVMLRARF